MSSKTKILVVDDEASIRLFLEEALTHDGYKVQTAKNGQTALEYITQQTFDLALVDLMLGDLSGMDIVSALKQQSPNTIAILLTAHASLETAIEALRQGTHDYLIKPCKISELRESVRKGLLHRQKIIEQNNMIRQIQDLAHKIGTVASSPAEQEVEQPTSSKNKAIEKERLPLQQGRLTVDFSQHIITIDNHTLELSPTQFSLLAYLISEAPRVISSQEIVTNVQGYESNKWEASEIVRSHIYYIRRKIKEITGAIDIIQTVRGVGYTINQ